MKIAKLPFFVLIFLSFQTIELRCLKINNLKQFDHIVPIIWKP